MNAVQAGAAVATRGSALKMPVIERYREHVAENASRFAG
jgi:hypothetical protein